jgi:hypothetical protein
MSLEIKFENFKMKDNEIIEKMYNRLMLIQNEFLDLGESLKNKKVIEKILRVMLRKLRWETLVSMLEVVQGANDFILTR